MTYAPQFDTILVNDKLEDSFAKADKIVEEFTGFRPKNAKRHCRICGAEKECLFCKLIAKITGKK